MTPRKLQALLKVHHEVRKNMLGGGNKKDSAVNGFIDNIPGW